MVNSQVTDDGVELCEMSLCLKPITWKFVVWFAVTGDEEYGF